MILINIHDIVAVGSRMQKYLNMKKQQPPQDTNTIKPTPITNNNCNRSSPAPINNVTITKKITPSANTKVQNKKISTKFDITSRDTNTLIGKRELKFPDYNYIKVTHSEKLYHEFKKLLIEFDDIFAKHQYDRRDLNVPPIKLGLRPEAYQHSIKRPQPTLSPAKTKAAIAIAKEHVNSGFFEQIQQAYIVYHMEC